MNGPAHVRRGERYASIDLPTDYCPQCCIVHVTCECPHEDETPKQYWRRMERLAKERAS